MHPDIQKSIDEFKQKMLDREIREQEMLFDDLSDEEDAELNKLYELSLLLVKQAV